MSWHIVNYGKSYDRSSFDCGEPELNDYLTQYISQDVKRKVTTPYLAVEESTQRVIGYYTIASAQVACKVGIYPVPCARIGRLAVDLNTQGMGVGAELLIHAVKTAEKTSKAIAIKAVIVDAMNQKAEGFYQHYGFDTLQNVRPDGRKTMFLVI